MLIRRLILLVLCCATFPAIGAPKASTPPQTTQTTPSVDAAALERIRQAIEDVEKEISVKREARKRAQTAVQESKRALDKAKKELDDINRRQRESWQKLQTLHTELESLKTEVAASKAQISRLLTGYYQNRQNNAVILFLKNAELGQKSRYLAYARAVHQANQKVIADLDVQQQQLVKREQELDAEIAKLAKLKAQKQSALAKLGKNHATSERENRELNTQIDQQNNRLAKLKADENRLNQVLAEIARKAAERRKQQAAERAKKAKERLAAIEKARQQQAAKVREAGKTTDKSEVVSTLTAEDLALEPENILEETSSFSGKQGSLPRPSNGKITGYFGKARPGGGTWRGVFYASTASNVKNIADGIVAYTGHLSGYGNMVIVDHGAGYTSIYAGLSSIAVSTGAEIGTGASIGTSGHLPDIGQGLYFELRHNHRTPLNPLAWVK